MAGTIHYGALDIIPLDGLAVFWAGALVTEIMRIAAIQTLLNLPPCSKANEQFMVAGLRDKLMN